MASQMLTNDSARLLRRRDINDNKVTALRLKRPGMKGMREQRFKTPCPKIEKERKPCRQLRKRRSSSLSLDDEDKRCKITSPVEMGFSPRLESCFLVTQSPHSTRVPQSPVTAIGNFIADIVLSRGCSSSCSLSYSSESGRSKVEEKVIEPTQGCEEEATIMYKTNIINPTTNEKWCVKSLRNGRPINISNDSGDYELYAWKIRDDIFVFGFRGSGGTYYVKTPDNGGKYLTLTTGGDPFNISDPSSDYRCMQYYYSAASGAYHLNPAHDTNSWVTFNSDGYVVVSSSQRDAASWEVSDH